MKNVLIIGGSAFTGRVFSILASRSEEYDLHVVNRGNYPLKLSHVTEYQCDRHNPKMMANLVPNIEYDALVDFCAYSPGDIKAVIDAFGARIKQYIFMSTASVYDPADGFLDEGAVLIGGADENSDIAADYILKKIDLERELTYASKRVGIIYTILRPTFIYGPFNYAPRESYFIERIAKGQTIPVPIDADARFNFVYVIDVARALMMCIGDKRALNEIFNLAGDEAITYMRLISDFESFNNSPFQTYEVTVEQVLSENIPLPFPLAGDTLYDGKKIARTFDFQYTPFTKGMEETFRAFYPIYAT